MKDTNQYVDESVNSTLLEPTYYSYKETKVESGYCLALVPSRPIPLRVTWNRGKKDAGRTLSRGKKSTFFTQFRVVREEVDEGDMSRFSSL